MCAAVAGKSCLDSQTLCNSLPASRRRVYLSNHLNDYKRRGDGSARISALTWWNFQGPERDPAGRFLVSLQKQNSCFKKCFPSETHGTESESTELWPAVSHTHSHTHLHESCRLHYECFFIICYSGAFCSVNISHNLWHSRPRY